MSTGSGGDGAVGRPRPSSVPLRTAVPLVAAGGATGSLARHGLAVALPDLRLATLLANLLGCLLLGLLLGATQDEHRRLLLGTGVLGGFTTTSALALQAAQDPGTGLLLLAASVGGGLALAAAGRRWAGAVRRAPT